MQPTPATIGALLAPTRCLWVPPYQRSYAWDADRWQSLARDIKWLVANPGGDHWFGIVMTAESARKCERYGEELGHVDWEVIDGQQRVLTFAVWVQALLDAAAAEGSALTPPALSTIWPQETNDADLKGILLGNWKDAWFSQSGGRLMEAYTYFRYLLWLGNEALETDEPLTLPRRPRIKEPVDPIAHWQTFADAGKLPNDQVRAIRVRPAYRDLLATTLTRSRVLVLEHQPAMDEAPAVLFSSLNGARMELHQFDHVRNWLFSQMPDHKAMMKLYADSWKTRERQLQEDKHVKVKGVDVLDAFLYDFLIARGEAAHQDISRSRTSMHFVRYATARSPYRGHPAKVAERDLLPAMAAWVAVKSSRPNVGISLPDDARRTLRRIEALSRGPAVPLLMPLVERYASRKLAKEELFESLQLVEGALARMLLAGRPFSPLRARIMDLAGTLVGGSSSQDLEGALATIAPKDREIREWWSGRGPFTSTPATPALLAVFHAVEATREGPLCKNLFEVSGPARFSIEHIFPREGDTWRKDLKAWGVSPAAMSEVLNHLGNLGVVPTSLNSRLKNKTFKQKREIVKSGRGNVELSLNKEWAAGSVSKWTPDKIRKRSVILLDDMLQFWPELKN